MFSCNYHTHTKRCGHATGEDEEYVLEAISKGMRKLGFSDHAMLPDFSEPYVRGEYSEFSDYVDSIRKLQNKYKDRIDIYLGMEAESFPEYFTYYKELLNTRALDYIILGNHDQMNFKTKTIVTRFSNITSASQLYAYRDLAIEALTSGIFSIFAHPDYFLRSIDNFDSDCRKVSRNMIECCIAFDIPLEVNIGGIRNGKKDFEGTERWIYPTDEFFSMVSRYHATCIFGEDAHSPQQLNDSAADYLAVEFAKRHALDMIDDLETIEHR